MNRKCIGLLIFTMLCIGKAVFLSAGQAAQNEPVGQVAITKTCPLHAPTNQPDWRKKSYGYKFHTGGAYAYYLTMNVHQRKDKDGEWKTYESMAGMAGPSYANWYHSGFFSIRANGKPVNDREAEMEIVETGQQGILDFTWDHPQVKLRARFIGEPGKDHLLMELRWNAAPEITNMPIVLYCYPQGFAVGENDRLDGKQAERHMITAERDVPQVQTVTLNLPAEWWQIYQDNTLHFSGPCALAIFPDDAENVTVKIEGYTVSIEADLKVASGRARFALWEFADQTPEQAKQIMLKQTPALLERMRSGSWGPSFLSSFNISEEKKKVDGISGKLGREGKAAVKSLRQQLSCLEQMFVNIEQIRQDVRAEREIRNVYQEYLSLLRQAERPLRESVRALVFAGPFAYAWKVKPTVKKLWGKDAVRQSGYIWQYWRGHFLSYFPGTMEELQNYDVVVLADVPLDPFIPEHQQMLSEFVQKGGGLLILGGIYAYGGAKWQGSILEPLLPVSIDGAFDRRPDDQHSYLALTRAGARRLGRFSFSRKELGVVPWYNKAGVRNGTEVWLTAGKIPFAVYSNVGKGRVLAVVGTVLGEPPEGYQAFYDTPAWTALLERILKYLARG